MSITYRLKNSVLFPCVMAFSSLLSPFAVAEDGVSENKILFGEVADLEGPVANLGKNMNLGIMAAFDEANRAGGVRGRTLELKTLSDGYDPIRAVTLVNQLIDQDKVFALIGMVGTASATATLPMAEENLIPFIGPYTGAAFAHDDSKKMILNIRASYHQEVDVMISYIVEKLKLKKISIFYQNDSFGYDGLKGAQASLEKHHLKLASSGAYTKGKSDISNALKSIGKTAPEAIVFMATYKQAAKFIKDYRALGFKAVCFCPSTVGSLVFVDELGADAAGVYVTQTVPSPKETNDPLVKRYSEALKTTSPTSVPDFGSLEGYVVGRAALAILEKTKEPLTRAGFLEAAHQADSFDINGYKLTYKNTTFASDQVFLFKINEGGEFELIEKAKVLAP